MLRMLVSACLLAGTAAVVPSVSAQQPGELDLDRPPPEFSEDYFDTEPWDPNYEPPRTETGHPDFTGNWTNVSLTGINAMEGTDKLVVTPHEAWDLIVNRTKEWQEDAERTDPDAPALEVGDADGVGGYNRFWIDPGSTLGVIDGEIRTSWMVEPAMGIELTPQGEALVRSQYERRNDFSNPEVRAVGERCVTGFGGTAGPPMLNVLYNNIYRFVQSEDTLAVVFEMVHQTRLIRIGGEASSKLFENWLGDSVARWDGDTLVVDTTGHHSQNMLRSRGLVIRPETLVTERFTRVADDTIFYEFTITDPEIYQRPHKAEMVFKASDKPQYEYACHEGNYSLPGILSGARREEQDAVASSGN